MSPLTYMMFIFYFSIRCGTYNSLAHNAFLQVWVRQFIMMFPFKWKPLLVSSLLVSLQKDWYCLYRCCCYLHKQTDCLGLNTLRRTGALIPLLGHWGELGRSSLLVSLQTNRYCLYRRCCFLRKQTDCLGRTLRWTETLIPLWVTEESSDDRPHRG